MAYLHKDRAFLLVSGADAFDYLQNMVSNDIRPVHEHKKPVYSLLLDNKGKYKFDFFVWPFNEADYLLETSISQIAAMAKLLKFYKLRADITLTELDDLYICSSLEDADGYDADPRLDSGLYRKLGQGHAPATEDSFDYTIWRIQNGLPEYEDLIANEDTPIEMGFDDLHAITYSKGCFLGQEGTNKAKHRLIIKKRLLPFSVVADDMSEPNLVNAEQRPAGEIRCFKQGNGLAVIRLKYLNEPIYMDGQEIKVHIPNWVTLPTEE